MKIQQLSELSGVSVKTIRYYEDVNLLPAPRRSDNGYRDYNMEQVEALRFIKRCRDLQIPIEDVKKLVNVQTFGDAPCQEVDRIVKNQLEKVRQTLKDLRQLEKDLSALSRSCAEHSVSQCEILKSLHKSTH